MVAPIDIKLRRQNITKYKFNRDGSIDVRQSIELFDADWTKFPVKINKIYGGISISGGNINTLQNMPDEVGYFHLTNCPIENLVGIPQLINGTLLLTNLKALTSLRGIPNDLGIFHLTNCPLLTSLDGMSCNIKKLCLDNPSMTSLHNIHKHVKQLQALASVHTKSNVLGLALIPGLEHVTLNDWNAADIINVRLRKQDIDILELQDTLIDCGFSEYAKL